MHPARSRLICALVLLVVSAANTRAGVLNGHPDAYFDGTTTWTGSTPFASGSFTGFVDYAVFGPGDFPFTGYTPTPGELAYTYQVFVTGLAPLRSFTVALTDPADNIDSFSPPAGDAPTAAVITPLTSADWLFTGIVMGSQSEGLVFSSLRKPKNLFGTVVNTGQSSFVVPLPSPGPNDIPEPAGAALAIVGVAVGAAARRRRR